MSQALSSLRRAVIGPPGWRFFSFWLALAITNLGTWAGVVALQLRVLDLTGDQAYVSAIVVAEYLPAVVLGTVLGHLLDRLPPRNGLAACELLAAAAWARSWRSRCSAASRPGSSRSSRRPSCQCSWTTTTWTRPTVRSSPLRRSRWSPEWRSAARSWDSPPRTSCCC